MTPPTAEYKIVQAAYRRRAKGFFMPREAVHKPTGRNVLVFSKGVYERRMDGSIVHFNPSNN